MSNKERKHNFPPGLSERPSIVDFIETSAAKCKLGAICRETVHSGGRVADAEMWPNGCWIFEEKVELAGTVLLSFSRKVLLPLLKELQKNRLTPDDIHWVVSTHGHSDHLGNNNLFLKAKHIVGTNISQRNRYFIHDFTSGEYCSICSCSLPYLSVMEI
ncbi:AAEL004768-PA [Aedes aegypti]|uniref:Metallo-beta-lactamase domain-containing protein 1 n=1 Tax=Aedes aegypti TaxID=7159 RepID=Q17BX5_AEDAE|nr:AAEL004768-PA [Aedes aegypti]